jgi:(p)ppGpp synthase/HD superfamily hydrolase
MERDTLGLADDSLFNVRVRNAFKAADADLLNQVNDFLAEKSCERNSIGYQAADLLCKQGADAVTIASALIAPLFWQNHAELNDIRKYFGAEVAATLINLRSPLHPFTGTGLRAKGDVHAILASIGGVPRRALLCIVFRLLALKAATEINRTSIRNMAQETLDLLVPIASRLSLGDMRRRLEDACFQVLDPQGYSSLMEKVSPIQAGDDKCLQILLAGVRRILSNNKIKGRVQGRTKSLHGIHRKMNRTGRSLKEIMDRVGIRVIVASVPECYTVLGLLHAHFKPIPGTFDDYIGLPKENGYQSLHTCVYPVREISDKPIEIQIRTELMHLEAEHGAAAHRRYKTDTKPSIRHQYQAIWIEGLARQHAELENGKAFVERLHRQVFSDHMVVFGNGGRIVRLSDKATVHDYLQATNLGNSKETVLKVNGKTVRMNHVLKDGDSIETQCRNSPGTMISTPLGEYAISEMDERTNDNLCQF